MTGVKESVATILCLAGRIGPSVATKRDSHPTSRFGRGPLDFYWALPPITRTLLTAFLITGIGSLISMDPLRQMYLQWGLVLGRFPPQLWRLVLCFAFLGTPSLGFLFHLVWLIQYGAQYERAKFPASVADAVVMIAFGMGAIAALDAAFPWARLGFHGVSLLYYLIYGWSRTHGSQQVSFMGLINLPGQYLPFLFVVMDLVQGASIAAPLLGIAAGHL